MNWWGIHKSLLNKVEGLKPWEIGEFTMAEIDLVLSDSKRTPSGIESQSDAEILAEVERWLTMTPLERLRSYER